MLAFDQIADEAAAPTPTSVDGTNWGLPQFEEAGRGGYAVDRVALGDDGLEAIDLKPVALKEFILANRDAFLGAAAGPITTD